ncbi:ADP-ribosyltransferase [Enterobacter phage vB_EclM_Q7622]|uniref:ADP-ribosyltransferase n=1 Tax=Enterobacter phage vB_EclM_Q7622 TaxID=2908628 RepID=UPI00232983EF|nr:ADP-ribosyltransferase [Enterobacter phage vB_EclM_Q7622]UIS65732.1 RNA polymerase ADP-ribosylase [Enterobacter phage vB_EclM_Q7622]
MSEQLNEVFESEGTMPVVNLNPKLKVPQIWKIGDVDSQLVARMVSYVSEGDAIKQVKLGDKYAHVILMSLSAKGTPAELKGGLGPEPINAVNTIFDTVYAQVKKLRMDAIMFRFPTKKMKGQGPIVQRVLSRLVMQKTGGRFKVVPSMFQFTGKHTYVLVVRKNAQIDDIAGMPGINPDLYTRVDSEVGEVYVSKKEGVQVTKETAIAGSIAAVEEKRNDRAVVTRTKISRRQIAASQSLTSDVILDPAKFEEYEATAAEFSKPATAPEIPEASQIKDSIESKAARAKSAMLAASGAAFHLREFHKIPLSRREKFEEDFAKELQRRIGDAPLTSVKSMQSFIQLMLDTVEEHKHEFIEKEKSSFFSADQSDEAITRKWNIERTKLIKAALQGYAKNVSEQIQTITMTRTPLQYTNAEKRGIKEYVGSGYSDINDMLLGRYRDGDTLTEKEATTAIKNLDDAFKKGDRLPEGITLWRSQTVRKPIFEAMVQNRVFYFRNFVSTSLSPIIFGGWKGNQGVAMASDNTRAVLTVDKSDETAIVPDQEIRMVQEYGEERIRVSLGWAIEGAHKINVVYPGDLSNMSGEMEVILPRGTMLQINKITDASYNDGMVYNNQKFIQAEVMTADALNESMVVYDGDALLESGELVAMDMDEVEPVTVDFSKFVKSTNVGLGLLASFIDIEDTPPKFVE